MFFSSSKSDISLDSDRFHVIRSVFALSLLAFGDFLAGGVIFKAAAPSRTVWCVSTSVKGDFVLAGVESRRDDVFGSGGGGGGGGAARRPPDDLLLTVRFPATAPGLV